MGSRGCQHWHWSLECVSIVKRLRCEKKSTCAWEGVAARNYPTERREASWLQSWEVHPVGQTQDASKPDEPLQQPR